MLSNCDAGEDSWRVPCTARRSNQSILKEINPEYSLEGLMLKLQSFGHLMQRADSSGKDPDAEKDWRQKEKGMTEDETIGWHHRLSGHEFEQAPGVGDGQGSLVCCSPWSRRVGHDWKTTTKMQEMYRKLIPPASTLCRKNLLLTDWYNLSGFRRYQHKHLHVNGKKKNTNMSWYSPSSRS